MDTPTRRFHSSAREPGCEEKSVPSRSSPADTPRSLVASIFGVALSFTALAQVPASGDMKASQLVAPGSPAYFAARYRHVMRCPLAAKVFNQPFPPSVAQFETDPDPQGEIGSYQPDGPTDTASNAFFLPLGTNGRSCFTCHQPASGMSISVKGIDERFHQSGLRDPLFAPVDGATCPKNVPASDTQGSPVGGHKGKGRMSLSSAYATLLQRGLIRLSIPVNAPPRAPNSAPTTEFTIDVVSDPYGCNTDPQFNQDEVDGTPVMDPDTGKPLQIISIYRRPRMTGSLNFAVTAFDFPGPPTNPAPAAQSGNIMWDGREPNLASQVQDAILAHEQATVLPTAAQLQQIIDFETGIFSAQVAGPHSLSLTDLALAGPIVLSSEAPGQRAPTFALSSVWLDPPKTLSDKSERQSIARGEALFNTRSFQISNNAGFNALPTPAKSAGAVTGTCSSCHSQRFSGNSLFTRAQMDGGIGGTSAKFGGPAPSTFLPIFKITCKPGVTLGFHGATILTNDPGLALITGKCADVGRLTVPQLRGLAARAPYFSDGSAATLLDVVDFYDKRYQIRFTSREKDDLVRFLNSL
jgi:cytochrome c peroxidase